MASLGEDLLVTVNKLQDLVFNTIGNDSLDLPQIVSLEPAEPTRREGRCLMPQVKTNIFRTRSWLVRNHPESLQSWRT